MIPEFTIEGLLPAGQFEATLEEFKERFASNIQRIDIFNHLVKLIEDLKKNLCFRLDFSLCLEKRSRGKKSLFKIKVRVFEESKS